MISTYMSSDTVGKIQVEALSWISKRKKNILKAMKEPFQKMLFDLKTQSSETQ